MMVDTLYLEKIISESGIKKSYLAEQLGISIQTLRLKITGKSDFTIREVNILCKELGITDLSEKEKIFNKM